MNRVSGAIFITFQFLSQVATQPQTFTYPKSMPSIFLNTFL